MFVITEWLITLTRHQLFLTHVHSLINNLLADFHWITVFSNSFMTFMVWSRPMGPWNEHWSWGHVFSVFFQNVIYSFMYLRCICLLQWSTDFIYIWYKLYFLQKLGLVCLPKEYNWFWNAFPNYLNESFSINMVQHIFTKILQLLVVFYLICFCIFIYE